MHSDLEFLCDAEYLKIRFNIADEMMRKDMQF